MQHKGLHILFTVSSERKGRDTYRFGEATSVKLFKSAKEHSTAALEIYSTFIKKLWNVAKEKQVCEQISKI